MPESITYGRFEGFGCPVSCCPDACQGQREAPCSPSDSNCAWIAELIGNSGAEYFRGQGSVRRCPPGRGRRGIVRDGADRGSSTSPVPPPRHGGQARRTGAAGFQGSPLVTNCHQLKTDSRRRETAIDRCRDHLSEAELIFTALAELSTRGDRGDDTGGGSARQQEGRQDRRQHIKTRTART